MNTETKSTTSRRTASARIIAQVEIDGTIPTDANYRTVQTLIDEGKIHFGQVGKEWRYKLGALENDKRSIETCDRFGNPPARAKK